MASQEETTGATAMSEDEFDGLDDPNDIFDDMPPLDVARDTLLLDLQATPPATQSQPRRRRERELTDDDGSDDNDGGNVEEGQGDRMSDYPLENSAVASQPQAQSQPLPQGLPVLPVMPLVSRSEASPTGVVNVTSAQIRSEIQGIRSACRRADLIIERSQQLHDELEHLRAMTEADDADNFELDAFDFGSRLQLVLSELEDVDEDAGAVAEDALPVEEARGSPEAEEGVEDMLCPKSPAASFFSLPRQGRKLGTKEREDPKIEN